MAAKSKGGAASVPAPLTQEHTLLNGRHIRFVMPDMYAFANGTLNVPNDVQASIYRLIYRGAEAVAPEQQLVYDQQWSRSMFHIVQLCTEPRVRLEADEEGEIDVREFALSDLLDCFSFFRYGPSFPLPAPTDQDAGASAETAPTGDDVPQGTE